MKGAIHGMYSALLFCRANIDKTGTSTLLPQLSFFTMLSTNGTPSAPLLLILLLSLSSKILILRSLPAPMLQEALPIQLLQMPSPLTPMATLLLFRLTLNPTALCLSNSLEVTELRCPHTISRGLMPPS